MIKPKIFIIHEETATSTPRILSADKKSVKIDTILQTAEEKNRNTRKYPFKTIDNARKRENVIELKAHKSWCGEAGHPHKPDIARQVTIDPKLISHRILDDYWKGMDLRGIVESLNTEYGMSFKNLIEQEMDVAFSLRAVGPFKETPQGVIVEDPMTMITYDWVILPSHKRAYQQTVLSECLSLSENLKESGNIILGESWEMLFSGTLQEATKYVLDESKRVKLAVDQLGFSDSTAYLTEDSKKIILSENSTKLVIDVEEYISRDISQYLRRK